MTRRSRRILAWSLGGAVAVGLLIVGYIVADQALRGVMEQQIDDEVTAGLPENVSVDPVVTVGGASAIAQYLSGSLDSVIVEADPITVDGVRLSAHLEAQGVPIDADKPVRDIQATAVIDQAALNSWTAASGEPGTVVLGDETVGYDGVVSLFGFEIGYNVAAVPVIDGPWIDLQPKTASVTNGSLQLDVKELLGALSDKNVRICAAQYLPAGISLSSIQVQPGEATVKLTGTDLMLAQLDEGTSGSCP